MDSTRDNDVSPVKSKQINVRITAAQDRLLKQYCVRTGVTTNTVILAALRAMIEGFEDADTASPKLIDPEKG